jgi:hypothetical protein
VGTGVVVGALLLHAVTSSADPSTTAVGFHPILIIVASGPSVSLSTSPDHRSATVEAL